MIHFHHLNLFDSGPARLHVGALTLRRAQQPALAGDGDHLVTRGREARPITQTGTLLSDSPREMVERLDAIEDLVDGRIHELVDESGRVWRGVVMLRFDPEPMRAAGARCRVDYSIDYLQVRP